MANNAEKTPEYQKYIKNYSHPLPIKTSFAEEYLTVGGDKNYLGYHAEYRIPIDNTKPLTKEYAEELADRFVNGSRTKAIHKNMEEIERD